MKEQELQDKVFNLLSEERFVNCISGYDHLTEGESDEFSMESILRSRYKKSVDEVFDNLGCEFQVIGGDDASIRSISMEKNERLYPDLLGIDDARRIAIFELKVNGKTERECITELMGYASEVLNHLPYTSPFEISLIIIANDYRALLRHAALQMIYSFGFNVLCLRYNYDASEFYIVNPVDSLSDNDFGLNGDSFSTISLCITPNREFSEENELKGYLEFMEDSIVSKAEEIGSNGFVIQNCNTDISFNCRVASRYYFTIGILNPYKMIDVLSGNTDRLSKYINEELSDSDHNTQYHYRYLIDDISDFFINDFKFHFETQANLNSFVASHYRPGSYVVPQRGRAWGDFGRYYHKHIISNFGSEVFIGKYGSSNTLLEFLGNIPSFDDVLAKKLGVDSLDDIPFEPTNFDELDLDDLF